MRELESALARAGVEVAAAGKAVEAAKEREEELLAQTARYAKQQITLDEYRAIAQESVKKANARTAEVAAQRHKLHEEAEAARRLAEVRPRLGLRLGVPPVGSACGFCLEGMAKCVSCERGRGGCLRGACVCVCVRVCVVRAAFVKLVAKPPHALNARTLLLHTTCVFFVRVHALARPSLAHRRQRRALRRAGARWRR